MPTPIMAPQTTRKTRRPCRSAVHPRAAIARMEEAAPTKRASPSGPGERSRARLRSASRTAKIPAKTPKTPKAPSRTGRTSLPGGAPYSGGTYSPPARAAGTYPLSLSVLGRHGEGAVWQGPDLVVPEEDRVGRGQAEKDPHGQVADLALRVSVGPYLDDVPQGPYVPRKDHR